jgi:membrane protein
MAFAIMIKNLIQETFKEWSEDKASRLAAALSYYTIFSIAPLLVIAIALAGLVFGREAATNQVVGEIRGLVGEDGAQVIQTILQNASKTTSGVLATVIGIVTLLIGASGAFGQLQDSLNTIWEVKPREGRGIKGILRDRFLSFSMVLVIGFLLLVSLVLSAVLSGIGKYLADVLPMSSVVLQAINFTISLAVTSLLFALIFKVLPDAYIRWRDVWVGSVVTALLFSLGRFLIGLYLGRSSVSSAYGAAGSLVVVLLWIYYSAQILFLGAEFTQVYAGKFGKSIIPKPNAVRLKPAPPDTVAAAGSAGATR